MEKMVAEGFQRRITMEYEKNEWKLIISRVTNGYIIEAISSLDELSVRDVIEDNEKDELASHENLLWAIMEYFNFGGSKHDSERLRITRDRKDEK